MVFTFKIKDEKKFSVVARNIYQKIILAHLEQYEEVYSLTMIDVNNDFEPMTI